MTEIDLTYLISRILYFLTTIVILRLMHHDRLKCVFSSGLLFIYWLFVSIACTPDLIDYSIKLKRQIKVNLQLISYS